VAAAAAVAAEKADRVFAAVLGTELAAVVPRVVDRRAVVDQKEAESVADPGWAESKAEV
jgi:hypothetical protein